ncbi:MAG TPA: hypothetical protein VEZ42_09450, partial [Pseudonocardia sp.]|nr:hypothetical protein [Pseudonocardia sp.]
MTSTAPTTGTGDRPVGDDDRPADAAAGSPAGPVDVPAEVARLRRTFGRGRTRPLAWRRRQLEGIERLVRECEPALAAALAEDLGRTAHYAWLGDFASTI